MGAEAVKLGLEGPVGRQQGFDRKRAGHVGGPGQRAGPVEPEHADLSLPAAGG